MGAVGVNSLRKESKTTKGKLSIIRYLDDEYNIHLGVEHTDLGTIVRPNSCSIYSDVKIINEDNFFISRFDLDEGTKEKTHIKRNGDCYEEVYGYQIDPEKEEDPILVLNEDILLISSFGLGFLYSISKEGPISPLFSKNACFIGLAGEAKRAIIEIPIPNCYEWEREIEKPKNYLYAVINENGKYISPVYNYNTGEVYPINTTPTDSLGISYNRMMSAIIKDAEASSDIFIGSNSSKQNFTKHLQPYMHRK